MIVSASCAAVGLFAFASMFNILSAWAKYYHGENFSMVGAKYTSLHFPVLI